MVKYIYIKKTLTRCRNYVNRQDQLKGIINKRQSELLAMRGRNSPSEHQVTPAAKKRHYNIENSVAESLKIGENPVIKIKKNKETTFFQI